MLAPIMHRVNCYVHYFFVPYRLIWDDWKEFITGGEDGLSQPVFPRFPLYGDFVKNGSLADYLGYNFANPAALGDSWSTQEYSLLPLRAYQMIYNEYYRDQNLTPEVQFSKASGSAGGNDEVILDGTDYETRLEAITELMKIRKRAWEKDYFTSALPWLQRGAAAQIPFGGELTIFGNGLSGVYANTNTDYNNNQQVSIERPTSTNNTAFNISLAGVGHTYDPDGTLLSINNRPGFEQNGYKVSLNINGSNSVSVKDIANKLTIDGLQAPTINELRLSNDIQKWLEINARVGSRYIEQILGHYGVRVPDFRLDRPEYLGGGKSPVQISEVLQTSSTDDITPQGNMSGHGVSVGNKNAFRYSFDEHGIVLGILSVLPRTAYYQGISRFLTKFDKFDHYFPEMAHLSEQAVKQEEIYNEFNDPQGLNQTDFGYQERYAEYKYHGGEVHGDFRDTLDFWHLGRKFATPPALNTSFVESDPSKRIFNVEDGNHMWCQVYNNVHAVRPMPKHAIPSL